MNLCIIPARGGSKRIPKKNIKQFCEKPMIAWSIDKVIQSNCFDKIWVSTDDAEIANIAEQYGATVPFMRPTEFSDDFSTIADVMSHAVDYALSLIPDLKYVCCVYATAPFLQTKDLVKGIGLLQSNMELDYVFSATNYTFPIQRAIKIVHNRVEMFDSSMFKVRSQDLEEAWHDAGQFYWGTAQAWLEKRKIFSSQSCIVPLPHYRVQDIDTLDDWHRAEILFKLMKG